MEHNCMLQFYLYFQWFYRPPYSQNQAKPQLLLG